MTEHHRTLGKVGQIPSCFEDLAIGGANVEFVQRSENQTAAAMRIVMPAIREARMRKRVCTTRIVPSPDQDRTLR